MLGKTGNFEIVKTHRAVVDGVTVVKKPRRQRTAYELSPQFKAFINAHSKGANAKEIIDAITPGTASKLIWNYAKENKLAVSLFYANIYCIINCVYIVVVQAGSGSGIQVDAVLKSLFNTNNVNLSMVDVNAACRLHLVGSAIPKKATLHNVKLYDVNPAFEKVVNGLKLTVPDTLKNFHKYLRDNNCQNATNKKSYNLTSELKAALVGTTYHQGSSILMKDILSIVHRSVLIKPPKAEKIPKEKKVKKTKATTPA